MFEPVPDPELPQPPFSIEVEFIGGLTFTQRAVFAEAAARWEAIITEPLSTVSVGGRTFDGVVISASGTRIDGEGRILGRAGPTMLRPDSLLPATGVMEFDTADLAALEADGSLDEVIVHEMGHVLGIGTLWQPAGLLDGPGGADPRFRGVLATEEYDDLLAPAPDPETDTGTDTPLIPNGPSDPTAGVPVANTGGPGSRDGHWRELVFGTELMTPFLGAGPQPLSRLTIASLADLGYVVSFDTADPYRLPSATELALRGVGDPGARRCHLSHEERFPPPIVLPTSALV
ncbi:leishmanolysin-related zinc metalloendopeptidase [Euzebya tangerina]|uniref:leishmanolysin-related zinc metalloendopeptidase n=1 Tax=Euzebya tangerina TaxID=591198 RepID=UPI000E31181A|nr:leishmanolysin-related zinc metalloendopeptidase [Euzebya tangerina]